MPFFLWNQFKRVFTVNHLIIFILCVGLLLWQLWPGSLESFAYFLFITAILWFPILLALGVHTVFKIFRRYRTDKQGAKLLFFQFTVSLMIMFCTLGLLKLHIPQRASFILFKSSFDSFVKEQQLNNTDTFTREHAVLNKRFGIWTVDVYAKDSRGGIYFRIGTGSDMIDTVSYGFVYKPNRKGTPFGNARYRYVWIIGDWYYFNVSDDW